jgi:hypothetical protein
MLRSLQVLSAIGLAALLAACGGGGSPDVGASSSSGTKLLPTIYTSEGRLLNSCSLSPACSGNPFAPFFANATQAPAPGATLSGVVRLEVRGNELADVQLLPATRYEPVLGTFNISGDRTLAWLDLDTTKLPNGPTDVRVSAFNTADHLSYEIVAMSARTWNISNSETPPAAFIAAATVAPDDGAAVAGIVRVELRGSGIVNAELLPAGGYTPRLGVFNVSADRTLAWLDFDTRSLPDGVTAVRVAAYDVEPGQAGATEIIALPPRNWNVSNGTAPPPAPQFSATATIAPAHGSVISGTTRLEVRGSELRNVELLPASGYLPRYGVFNISGDRTFAWLDFDSTQLPNGVLDARISAFNQGPGEAGAMEIVAMPARQWTLQH